MSPLRFEQRGRAHLYWLDGVRVKSVTTILGGGIPKPGLKWWAARVGGEAVADLLFGDDDEPTALIVERLRRQPGAIVDVAAGAHQHRTSEAQVKGTAVHHFAELVLGEDVEPPEDVADHVAGYVAFLGRAGVVVEMTERIVGSRRHGYAGRFDLIAQVRGERWLLDIKTGAAIYAETPCQTAAYARADFYIDDDGAEVPMPLVDRIGALHVSSGGTELIPLGDVDAAFDVFLNVKAVAEALPGLEAVVKAAPLAIGNDAGALF